jgi:GH15 family glucan-1,4-alpha-glucosidase
MASAIEDYALVGECESAALIGRNGSVDWLCWPRFDSDACFAALLGDESHGRWLVAPVGRDARVTRRRYRPNTLILDTEIETKDGFVMRHDPAEVETGLAHGEGAFLACSFWLADAYMLTGREPEARALFDRLLTLRNDVGLLSEEYDVRAKRLVGNFPQASSHIALVNTAHNLTRASKPAEQRAGRAEPGT